MATSGLQEVFEAVRSRDLLSVIQLYAEGVELLQPLPDPGKVGWLFFLERRSRFVASCPPPVPSAGRIEGRSRRFWRSSRR